MRMIRRSLAAAALAALLAPSAALAAGYSIYEQGAAALGMAGAATASVNDASALFFNPAAITRLPGTNVSVGGTWLTTGTSFAGMQPYPGIGVTEEMEKGNFFPPTFYVTHRYGEKFGVGLGVNAPFGLGIEWKNPTTFTGRTSATKAALQALNTQLSVAYALSPKWSVAAGFDMLMAKVELHRINTRVIPGGGGAEANVAFVDLESGFTPGYGWNAALAGTPNDQWKLGLNYRSGFEIEVDDADATFTQILTGNTAFDAAVAAGLPPAQKGSTTLKFPAMFSAGIAWSPQPSWTWETDFNWHQWSAFDELPLTFSTTAALNSVIPEDYEDNFQIRTGAEHRLPGWTYRFGYYYDQAAAPTESLTPLLPDASRHGATLGLGFAFGADKRWTLDLYNLALFVENRSTEGKERDGYDGVYKSFVNAAGASLNLRW